MLLCTQVTAPTREGVLLGAEERYRVTPRLAVVLLQRGASFAATYYYYYYCYYYFPPNYYVYYYFDFSEFYNQAGQGRRRRRDTQVNGMQTSRQPARGVGSIRA